MSNGHAGIGVLVIPQSEGKVHVGVDQWWSSAGDGASLSVTVPDRDAYELDMTNDETRQLAALLLEAAGNKDLAEAIPEAMAQIEARYQAQQKAQDRLRDASAAAEKAFLAATAAQREAFNAAVDEAERAYGPAAGYVTSRSVQLGRCPVCHGSKPGCDGDCPPPF